MQSIFLMEFESFKGRLFGVNCDLQCAEGICDAIGVFESVLMSLCDSVNCDAIDSEILECGKCDGIKLLFNYSFLFFDMDV